MGPPAQIHTSLGTLRRIELRCIEIGCIRLECPAWLRQGRRTGLGIEAVEAKARHLLVHLGQAL